MEQLQTSMLLLDNHGSVVLTEIIKPQMTTQMDLLWVNNNCINNKINLILKSINMETLHTGMMETAVVQTNLMLTITSEQTLMEQLQTSMLLLDNHGSEVQTEITQHQLLMITDSPWAQEKHIQLLRKSIIIKSIITKSTIINMIVWSNLKNQDHLLDHQLRMVHIGQLEQLSHSGQMETVLAVKRWMLMAILHSGRKMQKDLSKRQDSHGLQVEMRKMVNLEVTQWATL